MPTTLGLSLQNTIKVSVFIYHPNTVINNNTRRNSWIAQPKKKIAGLMPNSLCHLKSIGKSPSEEIHRGFANKITPRDQLFHKSHFSLPNFSQEF